MKFKQEDTIKKAMELLKLLGWALFEDGEGNGIYLNNDGKFRHYFGDIHTLCTNLEFQVNAILYPKKRKEKTRKLSGQMELTLFSNSL